MALDSLEHRDKPCAVTSVPEQSFVDISGHDYTYCGVAEIYGRAHPATYSGHEPSRKSLKQTFRSTAMNISPTLLLVLGICAAVFFISVFVISLIITVRNRRIIQKYTFLSDEQSVSDGTWDA